MTEYFCGVYKRIYFFSNSSKEEILYLYSILKDLSWLWFILKYIKHKIYKNIKHKNIKTTTKHPG